MFRAALKLIITLIVIVIPLAVISYYIIDTTARIKTTKYYHAGFNIPTKMIYNLKGDGTNLGAHDFWVTFSANTQVTPQNFEYYKETFCKDLVSWFKATLGSYEKGFIQPNFKKELAELEKGPSNKCYQSTYKGLGYSSNSWFLRAGDYYYYRSWEHN